MSNPQYYQKLIKSFGSIIRDGKLKPTIDYFDVDIDPRVLDNITVTLGPCTTEGDRLIVESLLKQYTQYGELKMSELHGTIRCKNQ